MEKKAWLAGLLSLVYPGLGQLYLGKTIYGIISIILMSSLLIIHFLVQKSTNHYIIVLIWFLAALGTYVEATRLNIDEKHKNPVSATCPQCRTENPLQAEECSKCGKELKKVLFYYDGNETMTVYPDIEINENEIIAYEKRMWLGTLTGKYEIYPLREIKNVRIKEKMNGFFTLNFQHIDSKGRKKQKKITMNIIKLDELRNTLDQCRVSYKP